MIKNAIRKYIKTKVQMVLCVSKEGKRLRDDASEA